MVENVGRKIALILTLLVGSVLLISLLGINLGLDLKGGTRLVYQVDFAAAVQRQDIGANDDRARVLRDMISVIRNRIDPDGVLDAVIVPQGARHNVRCTGTEPLKLYTIYAPPEHIDDTVHRTVDEANAAHEHFDGKTTE
jgi:preprotein translocase subunit SecD